MVNNEHQALLPMRLRGLLHLMTFLPDPVLYILIGLQTRCLLQPGVLPKSQATHTLNGFLEVRGMAHTQTKGFPTLIYQPLGLTSLPPDLLSSDSSPAMATKSRDWSSSASLLDGYECEIIGSTRPKAFFHFGRYPFSKAHSERSVGPRGLCRRRLPCDRYQGDDIDSRSALLNLLGSKIILDKEKKEKDI
ncbi:type II secretion system protein E [Striga asiatica]|uniref:Type II secretion system protein E n=1 Tax=Striga asiatica TaxID=4170 RepID=A0A5A7PZH7_STRAF|nr:type II secretion system protein E [Striga asiatica]